MKFVVNNSIVVATDEIIAVLQADGVYDPTNYTVDVFPGTGSFAVRVRNDSAGALAESVKVQFAILRVSLS